MTMIDHRTSLIVQAISWGIAFTGLLLLLFYMVFDESEPEPSKQKFKVVDNYKGCDVVQYTDPSQRYQYFLHCS
jgi:hypothetical protein